STARPARLSAAAPTARPTIAPASRPPRTSVSAWSRRPDSLRRQFAGDLRHVLPLEACDLQLVLAWHAFAIGAGQRGRAVGGAARDLGHHGEAGLGIRAADDDHAVMQERGVEAGDRRLLAAVLRAGAGKDAGDLADQRALDPQAARLIEEVPHLGAHV